ncbi:MAG: tetratricopeptide repeat protein [Nannocystaceae bacterium]
MSTTRKAASTTHDAEERAEQSYRASEVSKLFNVPVSRLRYWSQSGFIRPTGTGARGGYRFTDLISIKVAKGLLDAGVPLQRVRRSLDALRVRLPDVEEPLAALRIRCDHARVLVEEEAGAFEADTGQLVLDFSVGALRNQAAKVLELPRVSSTVQDAEFSAQAIFLRARARDADCREDGPTKEAFDEIESLYREALDADPEFAAAWTNLGGLLAERGNFDGARDAFDEALRIDPEQPEAQLNLSELALRDGDVELAIAGFRRVLASAPELLEAHYGLARALLEVGGKAQALAHLRRFCEGVERLPLHERDAELDAQALAAHGVLRELSIGGDGD